MHNLVMITHNYIMHNAYMQVLDNLCYLVHNPRRDLVHLDVMCARMIAPTYHMSRRDRMCIRVRMYSRDRSRRT